jgi:sodium-dependent dicarboxylate transporter 2/3/5
VRNEASDDLQETLEPGHVISSREQAFERLRRRSGLFLAPAAFIVLWFLPVTGLHPEAHRLLAVFGFVVTLWITEAIPLPLTALLGPALCVACGVAPEKEVFRSFGNPILFLFMGSFMLAQGMLFHGLNRRVAFRILGFAWVAASPGRILAAFGLITGVLSMWISNTTSAAMMFPIAVAILTEMARRKSELLGREVKFTELKYGAGLMLAAAFAASIGGMATPIGTPPNLIALGFIRTSLGAEITFFQWMAFGVPLAAVLLTVLVIYLNRVCPAESGLLGNSAGWIQQQRASLGPLSRGESNVLVAFGCTVLLWLLPGVVALFVGVESLHYKWLARHLPEGVCALLGAGLLFVLPVDWRKGQFTLPWSQARQIDWGTILLFGGGLAMGEMMFSTGLAKWIGEGLASAMAAKTTLGLIVLFAVIAVVLTETTSNTATANMIVPVAIAVSQAAGVDPLQPTLAVCLAASLAFMLPVSTPPNAVVYGSGCVPLLQMVRHGFVLDLFSVAAVVAVVYWLVPRVLALG